MEKWSAVYLIIAISVTIFSLVNSLDLSTGVFFCLLMSNQYATRAEIERLKTKV